MFSKVYGMPQKSGVADAFLALVNDHRAVQYHTVLDGQEDPIGSVFSIQRRKPIRTFHVGQNPLFMAVSFCIR